MKDMQLSDKQCLAFEKYLELLLKWNRTYNITAITDPREIYEKHFVDSIKPLDFLPKKGRLVDIGTGAGFPGIPIKILSPQLEVVLIEATRKKVNFCEHVIRELKLKGIEVYHGRAEDSVTQQKAGKFDILISRATMKLPQLFMRAVDFLNDDGKIIAMMGPEWKKEVVDAARVAKKCGFGLMIPHEYTLPSGGGKRSILVFARVH